MTFRQKQYVPYICSGVSGSIVLGATLSYGAQVKDVSVPTGIGTGGNVAVPAGGYIIYIQKLISGSYANGGFWRFSYMKTAGGTNVPVAVGAPYYVFTGSPSYVYLKDQHAKIIRDFQADADNTWYNEENGLSNL